MLNWEPKMRKTSLLLGLLIGLAASTAFGQGVVPPHPPGNIIAPLPAPQSPPVVVAPVYVIEIHECRPLRAVGRVVFLPVRIVGRVLFGGCR